MLRLLRSQMHGLLSQLEEYREMVQLIDTPWKLRVRPLSQAACLLRHLDFRNGKAGARGRKGTPSFKDVGNDPGCEE
jgi:hypothetical protein